jgi:hypothetical protein
MRTFRAVPMLIVLLLIAMPAFAKENRSGAGIAYTGGDVTVENVPGSGEFDGYTLFYKAGFNDLWGLLISYRDMTIDDKEVLPGEEFDYTQIGVHAVVLWRHGKKVRPFVKFGLARTEIDLVSPSSIPSTFTDDEIGFSVGGGLEAGSERIAFYADYDFTQVELGAADFDFANLALGIIFKF